MRHSKNERMELAREYAERAKALMLEIKEHVQVICAAAQNNPTQENESLHQHAIQVAQWAERTMQEAARHADAGRYVGAAKCCDVLRNYAMAVSFDARKVNGETK